MQKVGRSAGRAVDQLHRGHSIHRTTLEDGTFLLEDLAVDFYEVALAKTVHLPIASQDHASAVAIFLPR